MIRIAGYEPESIVDGPGVRFTLFTQGCLSYCPGCHNPKTWPTEDGQLVSEEKVLDMIHDNPLVTGVTFSGGEPYLQASNLEPLAKTLKAEGYNLWCYTGWLWNTVSICGLTRYLDVVVDGRFEQSKKSLELKWRGSSNQRVINVQASLKNGRVILVDD